MTLTGITQQTTTQPQQQEEGKFLSLKDRIARYNNAFGGTTAAPPPLPTKAQYTSAGVQRAVEQQQRSKPDLNEPSPRNSVTNTPPNRRSSESAAPQSHYRRLDATRGSNFENLKGGAHVSTPDLSVDKEQQDGGSAKGKPMKLADRLAAYQQAASATGSTASLQGSRDGLEDAGSKRGSQGRLFGGGASAGSRNQLQGSRELLSNQDQNRSQGSRDHLSSQNQNQNKSSNLTSAFAKPSVAPSSITANTSTTTATTSTTAPASSTSTPSSSAAAKFGGTPRCDSCSKPVYLVEQLTLDGKTFHKTCLKCAHCKATLKMGNLASMEGVYYCKPHFKQLFKTKGNYSEGFGKVDPKKAWVAGAGGSGSAGGSATAGAGAAPAVRDVSGGGGAAALAKAGRQIVGSSGPAHEEREVEPEIEKEVERKEEMSERDDSNNDAREMEKEPIVEAPTTERQSKVQRPSQSATKSSSQQQEEGSRDSSVGRRQEGVETDTQQENENDTSVEEGIQNINLADDERTYGADESVGDDEE